MTTALHAILAVAGAAAAPPTEHIVAQPAPDPPTKVNPTDPADAQIPQTPWIGAETAPATGQPPQPDAATTALAQMESFVESAIRDGDHACALELTAKILALPENRFTPRALELQGVVQARQGLNGEARQTFTDYLRRYPGGEGATRVGQRLAAIEDPAGGRVTAKLRPVDDSEWHVNLRGIASQFYYRDTSRSVFRDARDPGRGEAIDPRINVDQLLNAVDATLTAAKGDLLVQVRAAGLVTQDFRPVSLVGGVRGGGDTERITNLYFDLRDARSGLSGRLGRQQLLGSGVFGRFDGARMGWQVSRAARLGMTIGHPVQTSRHTGIDDGRTFYGVNFDYAWPGKRLWTSVYLIEQRASGLVDRQAIGAEVRVKAPRVNLAGIVDYDVRFGTLSQAYVSLNYVLSDRSAFTLTADHLHYPLLATSNAIIGQPDPDLGIVSQRFDRRFIHQLAKDRTRLSRSLALTWSQTLSHRWAVDADIAILRTRAAPASGGVAAIAGTGTEYQIGGQIVGSGIALTGDAFILGVRYADVARFRIVSADFRARIPVGPRLRVEPRVRVSYRDDDFGTGHLASVQSSLRAVYRLNRSIELDVELGRTVLNQKFDEEVVNGKRRETAWIANLGYRLSF